MDELASLQELEGVHHGDLPVFEGEFEFRAIFGDIKQAVSALQLEGKGE